MSVLQILLVMGFTWTAQLLLVIDIWHDSKKNSTFSRRYRRCLVVLFASFIMFFGGFAGINILQAIQRQQPTIPTPQVPAHWHRSNYV